jgi:protoporphyrin/coproporphyrin ferrochelatase
MGKQAVLLLAHGTPETVEQIPEYLRNVVSGRPVPPHVVAEIQHRYALIGRSPLTEITLEQARLVEEELNDTSLTPHPSDKNKDVARAEDLNPVLPTLSTKNVERMGQPEEHDPTLNAESAFRMGHPGVRVYVGMRNWKPYIADVVRQMRADGVEQAAVICMAPQNSRTSVGLYRRAVEAEAQGLRIDFTEGWARHPLLIEAFAERLRPAWTKLTAQTGQPVPVLFTAHSVPKRTVEPPHPGDRNKDVATAERSNPVLPTLSTRNVERMGQRDEDDPTLNAQSPHGQGPVRGDPDLALRMGHPKQVGGEPYWPGQGADPYAEEARHTAELVAARVPEIPFWRFAFQSQGASGGEWIGPSVEETLEAMAREGVKTLLLQPIGFLCDHVEILFDVDRLFREYAAKLGIRLERPESLNDSRTLARAVAGLAQKGLARLSA